MKRKTIIITGSSDGIGAASAEKLCALGHNVIIVGRNAEKTEKIASRLKAPFHIADYTRLSDVVRLSEELRSYKRIDVLVNNAGGAFNKRSVTRDGFEKTFQVNVLGGFLLTRLLTDKLCRDGASVIQTTSLAANLFSGDFDIDDLNSEKKYVPINVYGNAKLCDIFFIRELNRRYGKKGIFCAAFEPGIVRTNFGNESTAFLKFAYHSPLKYLFTISPEKSARRLVYLCLAGPGKDYISGRVYSGKKEFNVSFKDDSGRTAEKMWDECERMLRNYLG